MSCIVLALKMSQVCHTKAFLGLILQFKVDTLQTLKSLFLGGCCKMLLANVIFMQASAPELATVYNSPNRMHLECTIYIHFQLKGNVSPQQFSHENIDVIAHHP